MNIRPAIEADEAVLRELWEQFEQEVPWPLEEPETWADEWPDTLDDIRAGGVFLAEDEQERSASPASRRRSAGGRTSSSST